VGSLNSIGSASVAVMKLFCCQFGLDGHSFRHVSIIHYLNGFDITFYSHAADIWMPFGKQQVISTNESEAWYVINTLCHHESDLHIQEHYTDTGGSSDHVFALTALLGFKFAPRISSSLDK